MSKKNQNYTNRKQNRFQPERMRGNVFINNSGKQWLPGENGRAAKVERLLKGVKEEKKEIAGNMAGYKETGLEWMKNLPAGWKVLRIKDVIEQNKNGIKIGPFGSSLSNKTLAAGPYNVYGQANLIKNSFLLTKHAIDENLFKKLSSYEVYSGDICVSMMGTIGKCKVVPENIKRGIMDSHLIKLRLSKEIVLPSFFEYAYDKDNCDICFTQMQYEKVGVIMDGLNTSIVKKLHIPVPPLPEQQRIADFLDTKCGILDRTIDAVSRQIEDLEKYKKALITKTVTKGICKKGEPERAMKDSGVEWIGEVPEEWSVKRLKYVLDSIRNGASAASYEYEHDSFRYVRITDIDDNGNLKQTGKQYLPKEMAKNFILNKKAVLIANTGSLGKAMLFDPDKEDEVCALNGHLIEAIANPNIISNEYLYFFIKSYNYINWVNRSYVQTTMQMLSAGRHKNLPVTVPPLAEQQQIADYLDEKCKNIDNRVQKRRQQLEWLKEYKKSLIFDYVTGKKRA